MAPMTRYEVSCKSGKTYIVYTKNQIDATKLVNRYLHHNNIQDHAMVATLRPFDTDSLSASKSIIEGATFLSGASTKH